MKSVETGRGLFDGEGGFCAFEDRGLAEVLTVLMVKGLLGVVLEDRIPPLISVCSSW